MTTTPKLGTYNYRFGAIAAGIGIVFSLMLYFMDMTYEQSPVIQVNQCFDSQHNGYFGDSTVLKKITAGLL